MPFIKRPSITSFQSSSSGTSGSTPNSVSSSLLQPSPLAYPGIMEDEDEAQPPLIEIGDEVIDNSPFDPSIPDEIYWQMMQQAALSPGASSPSSGSFQDRFSRLLGAQRPGRAAPPSANTGTLPGSPPTPGSWKSVFKKRRESATHDGGDAACNQLGQERRVRIQEPAEIISCTKGPKVALIPLGQAQQMDDIVHRMEGYEMAERRRDNIHRS